MQIAKQRGDFSVTGKVLLNGKEFTNDILDRVAGFVHQEPHFFPYGTCQEALHTAALLKLPRSLSKEERENRVQVLLEAFDLTRCADSKIGDETVKGLSGGEKKRLSIAIEVLSGPSLIFLDEPTTGLDSASSLLIMQLLKELALQNTSIIMVLHQPRAMLLDYIDTFLVMSRGKTVFFGGLDNMFSFFENCGMSIPLRTNPMDYVLDLINTNEADITGFGKDIRKNQTRKSVGKNVEKSDLIMREDLADMLGVQYLALNLYDKMFADLPSVMPPIVVEFQQRSNFGRRLFALLVRDFRNKFRNPWVFACSNLSGLVGVDFGLIVFPIACYGCFQQGDRNCLCWLHVTFFCKLFSKTTAS
jgi:ABC-type multidrug transport system ATPase subunit